MQISFHWKSCVGHSTAWNIFFEAISTIRLWQNLNVVSWIYHYNCIISPILGLANAPIVGTKFLELAMSLLDFSPRIPIGTFSILLHETYIIIWILAEEPNVPIPRPRHVYWRDDRERDWIIWRQIHARKVQSASCFCCISDGYENDILYGNVCILMNIIYMYIIV